MNYLKNFNLEKIIRACGELVVTFQHNPDGARRFIIVCGMLFVGWMWAHR